MSNWRLFKEADMLMSEPVFVRVHAVDPISESGILTQLGECPGILVTDSIRPDGTRSGLWPPVNAGGQDGSGNRDASRDAKPSVALAVTDSIDDGALGWLRGLHQRDGVPIVLVVGRIDAGALITVIESGVRAVVIRRDATPARLAQLLRDTAIHRSELPPELLGQLLDQVSHLNRSLLAPRGLGLNGLTHRESAILRLVADGMSTREVAVQLAYSERTIKAALQELTTRLDLRNRAHAVAYAIRSGWI
jgi:DNA-binding NarL/FixJ family response regulator